MYYIEKTDKQTIIERLFKIIKIQEDKIILPVNDSEFSEKQSIILANKTHKILQKTRSNKIVLEKNLHQNETYINLLYSYEYDIVDGKWLFEAILNKILDYIIELKNIKKQEIQISILVNNLTDYTLENIKILANEYKTLNIVTNHMEKFKNIEKKIFENQGLILTVTNNKKKSLSKSKIIINIDFPSELLNRYNIFDEAIIVSLMDNVKISKKRFNGILINDYEISTDVVPTNEKYFIKEIYESEFYKHIPFNEFQEKIKKDNVKVQAVYGINGKIS